MAARAGALIADPEFVQFHPTAIDAGIDPAPLATEALRGEGAIICDKDGTRLMENIHPDMELAPRDIVARTVFNAVISGKGAFLDCRSIPKERLINHFQTVIEHCRKAGLDPTSSPIPIAPAAHFHMGGVVTDQKGRTTVPGLWACGEVAATGLHGANRLASNSLLEAIVFAGRIAEDLTSLNQGQDAYQSLTKQSPALEVPQLSESDDNQPGIAKLRDIMFTHAGLERSEEGLKTALRKLDDLESEFDGQQQNLNMLLTARFILMAALARQESLGSHYRTDDKNGSKHNDTPPLERTFLTLAELEKKRKLLQPHHTNSDERQAGQADIKQHPKQKQTGRSQAI